MGAVTVSTEDFPRNSPGSKIRPCQQSQALQRSRRQQALTSCNSATATGNSATRRRSNHKWVFQIGASRQVNGVRRCGCRGPRKPDVAAEGGKSSCCYSDSDGDAIAAAAMHPNTGVTHDNPKSSGIHGGGLCVIVTPNPDRSPYILYFLSFCFSLLLRLYTLS